MRGRYCAEQVAEIFALAVGVPTSELLAELQAGCECMEIDPALLAAIGQLRASGTKVVLATDNMDSFTRWTVPALGLERHFDGILNSFDLGGLKEDRDAAGHSPFFSLCLDSGIYRPPYLLIDDSPGVLNVRDLGVDVITVSSPADTLVVLHRLCDQATAANRPLPAAALTI
jgi:FMN phosphatase YigB (HAD superfamily)